MDYTYNYPLIRHIPTNNKTNHHSNFKARNLPSSVSRGLQRMLQDSRRVQERERDTIADALSRAYPKGLVEPQSVYFLI